MSSTTGPRDVLGLPPPGVRALRLGPGARSSTTGPRPLLGGIGDNDAGVVATYSQAGQNYGYSLLWVLLLLIPVLVVNQEIVVRLGGVTGVGHARLLNERFGRGWGWFSVGDLFLLNFLTIVTEFIGVSLAANYIGLSRYIVVSSAAIALIAIMATGSVRRWQRAMFLHCDLGAADPAAAVVSPPLGVTPFARPPAADRLQPADTARLVCNCAASRLLVSGGALGPPWRGNRQ